MLRTVFLLATVVTCIARADNPSIFMVGDVENTYTGTAFSLQTEKGIITVTNAHVCSDRKVLLAAINHELKLVVVNRVYRKHDLCILNPIPGIPALHMGNDYHEGQFASTEGFPKGKHRVTKGSVGHHFKYRDAVSTEYLGEVDSGASGSPVFDRSGNVIGVIQLKFQQGNKWLGGMVPLEYLKDFISNIPVDYLR